MWVGSASPTAGRDAPRMSPGSGRRLGVGCWRGFHRGPRSRPGVARADLEFITAPRAALQDRSADGSRAPVAHKYRVMVDVRDLRASSAGSRTCHRCIHSGGRSPGSSFRKPRGARGDRRRGQMPKGLPAPPDRCKCRRCPWSWQPPMSRIALRRHAGEVVVDVIRDRLIPVMAAGCSISPGPQVGRNDPNPGGRCALEKLLDRFSDRLSFKRGARSAPHGGHGTACADVQLGALLA